MPAGLQIFNPSNTLVLAADGIGYNYYGSATQYTAGTVNYNIQTDFYGNNYAPGDTSPYVYRITLPAISKPPLVGFVVSNSRVTCVDSVKDIGSNVWEIKVWSVNAGGSEYYPNYSVVDPGTIYVFIPYIAADITAGAGMQLFNPAGELCFSTNKKPLWLKERIDFSTGSAVSQTWSGNSGSILFFGGIGGLFQRVSVDDDQIIYRGYYGFKYSGTTMNCEWFLVHHANRPTNGSNDETGAFGIIGISDTFGPGANTLYAANSALY